MAARPARARTALESGAERVRMTVDDGTNRIARVKLWLRRHIHRVSAHAVTMADRIEARLPSPWARRFGRARDFNPMHVVALVTRRARHDGRFLGRYMTASSLISHLSVPTLIGVGLPATAAFALSYSTWPINIAVFLLRERYLRRKADPGVTMTEVLADLRTEHGRIARGRRSFARVVAAGMAVDTAPLAAATTISR